MHALLKAVPNQAALLIVGDVDRWIWLPPTAMWAPWAVQGLDEAIGRSRLRGFPTAPIWNQPAGRLFRVRTCASRGTEATSNRSQFP
jgi:hypothetical protein